MAKNTKAADEKDTSMFLRFYGVSQERIDEGIAKIRALHPEIINITKGPLTGSVNPGQSAENNTEVLVFFGSKKEVETFYTDDRCRRIYLEYSTTEAQGPATLVLRKKGDVAFGTS